MFINTNIKLMDTTTLQPVNYYYCTSNNTSKDSSPSPDHNNTHELNLPQLSRTKSISTLSHDHHHSKPAMGTVFETRQHDPPPREAKSSTPLQRLFSSSGLDEAVATSKEEEEGNGGNVVGGGGRSDGGGSGFHECGNISNNYHGHGSMEAYYIQLNPGNSLLLGNYAKFLKQVNGDIHKAEEYCERAILTSPSDSNLLSLYSDIIWQTHRDAQRSQTYFDQAVKSAPNDCYVLVSYAKFPWEVEEGE